MTEETRQHDDEPAVAEREAVLEYELSQFVALGTEAVPHCCAKNAWRALICVPDLFFPTGEYIEGWMVYETETQVMLVEHCWTELAPGPVRHIVDPSIVFLVRPGQPVRYFVGVRRSWRETEALEGELFPHVRFDRYGEDGLGHPGYRAAFEQARHYGSELAKAASPPRDLAIHTAQEIPDDTSEEDAIEIIVFIVVPPS